MGADMGGQRGRPKGSKDTCTQRKTGRWSEGTRARLGLPAMGASRSSASARVGVGVGRDIRQGWAQAASGNISGGNSSAADVERAGLAAAEEAEARRLASAAVASALAMQAADEAAEAEAEAEAEARAARDDVQETEIDDDEGLRAADSRNSITMIYFRLVQARLQVELSNRSSGLTDRWLLAMLKVNDYWLRAREKRKRTCQQCCDGTDVEMRQTCPGRRRKADCVNRTGTASRDESWDE